MFDYEKGLFVVSYFLSLSFFFFLLFVQLSLTCLLLFLFCCDFKVFVCCWFWRFFVCYMTKYVRRKTTLEDIYGFFISDDQKKSINHI